MVRKKKKAAKKQPKKVTELSQTHGMAEKEEFQPTSLDKIWGDTGLSKYKTLELAAYQGQLNDMGKSDLQAHAVTLGLIPIDDSKMLRRRLEREFKKHAAKFQKPAKSSVEKDPVSEEVKRILSEGR
jgi:hypothetical protein